MGSIDSQSWDKLYGVIQTGCIFPFEKAPKMYITASTGIHPLAAGLNRGFGQGCIPLQIEKRTTQCDQQLTAGVTEGSIEKLERFVETVHPVLDIAKEK